MLFKYISSPPEVVQARQMVAYLPYISLIMVPKTRSVVLIGVRRVAAVICITGMTPFTKFYALKSKF